MKKEEAEKNTPLKNARPSSNITNVNWSWELDTLRDELHFLKVEIHEAAKGIEELRKTVEELKEEMRKF